jgi:hypothetical protein
MALSPEAIIAMIALFVACAPGLRFMITYYQSMVRQGQNRIQTPGLSSMTLDSGPLGAPIFNSGHDRSGILLVFM